MRLLIVEDEAKTRAYLSQGMQEAGFIVDAAPDGGAGRELLRLHCYDVAILDVRLPIIDGWSLITQLRRSGSHIPVLFLTACDCIDDLVKGLNLGADDYLVKPFIYAELLARVRALVRRGALPPQADTLRVADLELDFIKHQASRSGGTLDLTPKEFALLTLLVQRQGEVLSRTLIACKVWDINFDGDTNLVDVSVSRLRRKVDGESRLKLIHTVRGVGYVLEAR